MDGCQELHEVKGREFLIMKINKVHCLFEQSGTFKNEFLKLGIPAEDYDIRNDFGETDHVIDLFSEIDKAYDGEPSIFDEIGSEDLILAFFPCTRFESQISLHFRGEAMQLKNYSDEQKLAYVMKLHNELHRLYELFCKMFTICIGGGTDWLQKILSLSHIISPRIFRLSRA